MAVSTLASSEAKPPLNGRAGVKLNSSVGLVVARRHDLGMVA
jgi:hypothetical protein